MKSLLSLLVVALLLSSCAKNPDAVVLHPTDPCYVIRGAIDMGSGTTRIKVAEVNQCEQKISGVISEKSIPLGFEDNRHLSKTGVFSAEFLDGAIAQLQKAKAEVAGSDVTRVPKLWIGVATSAFRKAPNGAVFISRLKKELGWSLKLISSDEEAALGFRGAVAKTGILPADAVVWDIGGGSMQLVSIYRDNRTQSYSSDLASVGLKNAIIEKIQKSDVKSKSSPNPIQENEVGAALALVKAEADKVPGRWRAKAADTSKTVLGIGGVLYNSVREQLGSKNSFTVTELQDGLRKNIAKTDAEVGGPYAATQVSNLILVLGWMESLGISQVRPIKVNLTDGILISESYWAKPL